MKQYAGWIMGVGLLAGCTAMQEGKTAKTPEPRTLEVRWQRLVDESGNTCDRCGVTEPAVADAVRKLRRSLKREGVRVVLEKEALTPAAFASDPLQSNRIWIAGKPIEEWLGATIGESQCDSVCGDSACRTVTINGRTYEAMPADLILEAGRLAAAQLPPKSAKE